MPRPVLVALLTVLAACAGCGGSGGGGDREPATRTVEVEGESYVVPTQPERLVVLGEEFLLADVLDLGFRPVASTATLGTRFTGIDPARTKGIEPLDLLALDVERLLALRPDLVLADEIVTKQPGIDRLARVVPVIPVGDARDWRAAALATGRALGREDDVQERLARYDAAVDDGASSLGAPGRTVSVMTAYPDRVVAWVDGPANVPQTLQDLGFRLVPDRRSPGDPETAGRASLSLEQVGRLRGRDLVLLQSGAVQGEDQALARLRRSPLFERLPAARAGRVRELDRLGFPGVGGRLALVERLVRDLAR